MGSSAFLYSVNPFPVYVELGVAGKMVIPGRGKDERYTRLEIKARPLLHRPRERRLRQERRGRRDDRPRHRRAQPELGLFVGEERGPSKAELQAATDTMLAADQARVTHGDELWANSNHNRSHIGNDARQACVRLGYTREWADGDAAQAAMKRCRACAEVILGQAIICKHCGWNQTKDPLVAEAVPPPAPEQKAAPVS